jgi:hypothetical protein
MVQAGGYRWQGRAGRWAERRRAHLRTIQGGGAGEATLRGYANPRARGQLAILGIFSDGSAGAFGYAALTG